MLNIFNIIFNIPIRILFLTVICFPGNFNMSAQETDVAHKKEMQLKWGPKVGLDFTAAEKWYSMRAHDSDESFLGASAGVTVRFIWNNHWYIQPEFMLEYDNMSAAVKNSGNDSDVLTESHVFYDISRFAVQLPVHLGYRFTLAGDVGMSVFTGAFTQCGIGGKIESHDDAAGRGLPHYSLYGSNGVWHRWNFGAVLGVTFEIGECFVVSVDGNFGFRKMNRKNIFADRTLNESIGRVAISYWIR